MKKILINLTLTNFRTAKILNYLLINLVFLSIIGNTPLNAQSSEPYTIRGQVFDTQENPNPLPGVSVIVEGTNKGAMTDMNGAFEITANDGEVLVFSMVGFKSTEHQVTRNRSNLSVSLQEDVSALDEVMVVGFTEQRKRHMASAVSSLDVDSNIRNKPITMLSQSLQGGVTGVSVTQSSGMPGGDAAAIKIRGISTLGYSNPLILVDGVPMDMNHIDPVTVESVTVLKDAAAAAIYGSRAANGVILVTTKRGVVGEVKVNYDGYYGIQTPTYLPETVNGPMYMQMSNEARINAGLSPTYTLDDIMTTYRGDDPLNYPNTNWRDLIVDFTSPIQNHSLSVSGGSSLARFAVTGNYIRQEGMIPNNSFDRVNIRANTSISLNEDFLLKIDLLAIKRDEREPNRMNGFNGNRILQDIYRVPPTVLPRYPEVDGISSYGHYADIVNPLAYAERGGQRHNEQGNVAINVQPTWEVARNFNLNGQFSFRLNSDLYRTVRDNTLFFNYFSRELVQTWGTERGVGTARSTNYYVAANADYTLDLGDHYLFAIAGYSQEENNTGLWDVNSLLSGYAKVNYSFRNKYLFEATIRADGSSRFGPGKKFGYFPSVAVGWNVHNEDFLSGSSFVNNLKLRASYGQLGNENIGLYRYQTLVSAGNGVETASGNPNISWETVNMLNLGLDLGLFENNRLEITLDLYDKVTEGVILTPPLPFVGGFEGAVPVNAGEVSNRGVELAINYNETIGQDFYFSVRPGISYNRNRIESLLGGPYVGSTWINEVGGPIGAIYGYRTGGLLQEEDFDEAGNPLVPTRGGNAAPGDIRYYDLDGDGIVDANDQERIGNPNPRLQYFTNFEFNYKNWDFEFLLQGTGQSDSPLRGFWAHPLSAGSDGGVPTRYYSENYWTPTRTDARFPRTSTIPTYNMESSDFWFQNAAYLRVKYIQLGYTFDTKLLDQLGSTSFRVYANAQNPFTFTSMEITDPESRGNEWTYGNMEMYTVGLNIRF